MRLPRVCTFRGHSGRGRSCFEESRVGLNRAKGKEGTTRFLGSAGFLFTGMVCSMSWLYLSSFWVAQGQGGERCG